MSPDPFGHPGQPGTTAAVKFERHGSGWPVGDVDAVAAKQRRGPGDLLIGPGRRGRDVGERGCY
jgi:hypothetical protein